MKLLPKYIKKGDPVSASEYNKQVRNTRSEGYKTPYGATALAGVANRKENPFSMLDFSINTEGENPREVIKIKAGYIFQGTDAFQIYTSQTTTGDYVPIETVPEIVIPPQLVTAGKGWLYVDLDKYELLWAGETEFDSRAIYVGRFEFTKDGDTVTNIKYVNLHPSNIQKTLNSYFIITPWNQESTVTPLESAPETCNVTISNGYVINNDSRSIAEEVLVKHKVSNGQDPAQYLDDELSPLFEGVEPDAVIYVRVQTDDQGFIVDTEPAIFIGEENQTSIHYQPEPVPVNGDYYYPIAKIKLLEFEGEDGTFYQFVAEQMWNQNIFMQQDLPTLKNVGEKREVFKEIEEETSEYKFRTLEQLEGTNSYELIKKEPENPIEAAEKETIEFKYLTEKASSPQIQLENIDDDKGIRIKGNNYVQSFAGLVKALSVNDGLVTVFQEAQGWSGEIQLDFVDNVNPSNDTYLSITVENGLITVVNDNGVNVPNAGLATFSTNNTA